MAFDYSSLNNVFGRNINAEVGGGSNWASAGGSQYQQPQLISYGINTAAQVNQQNRDAQTQANQARLGAPGVALQSTLLGNAQRKASGLLDPETEQMLRQGIAASGVSSGMGVDSANLSSAYRRALGLDINAVEDQALKDYSQLTSDNPGAPVYGAQNLLTQPTTATGGGGGGGGGSKGGGGGGGAPAAAPAAAAVDPFGGYGGSITNAGNYESPFAAPQENPFIAASGSDYSPTPAPNWPVSNYNAGMGLREWQNLPQNTASDQTAPNYEDWVGTFE